MRGEGEEGVEEGATRRDGRILHNHTVTSCDTPHRHPHAKLPPKLNVQPLIRGTHFKVKTDSLIPSWEVNCCGEAGRREEGQRVGEKGGRV